MITLAVLACKARRNSEGFGFRDLGPSCLPYLRLFTYRFMGDTDELQRYLLRKCRYIESQANFSPTLISWCEGVRQVAKDLVLIGVAVKELKLRYPRVM